MAHPGDNSLPGDFSHINLRRRRLTANQVIACTVAAALLYAVTWNLTPSTTYWKALWTALVCLSAGPIASMPSELAWDRCNGARTDFVANKKHEVCSYFG